MTDHTRETTPLFVKTSGGTFLPVVHVKCDFCGELVDPLAPESDWSIARVRGDSANGYALMHNHDDDFGSPWSISAAAERLKARGITVIHEDDFDWPAWERDNLHPADECLNGCHDVDYGADESTPTTCTCSPAETLATVTHLNTRGISVEFRSTR